MRMMQGIVCLLSILLMLILGEIGEELLGIATAMFPRIGLGPDSPPDHFTVTAFIVGNYRPHQGHFLLSLVPFLGLLAAMPFLDRTIARWESRFWYAFTGAWLAFAIYFAAFAYGLMVPFTHMAVAADHQPTLVTYATLALCILLVAALVGLHVLASRRGATLRQAFAADIPAMHRVRLAVQENRLASAVTEADYVPAIEETGRGWVVETGGQVVAFAVGNKTDGNIWALFVDPAHERKGYGRRLHDEMVGWLRDQGLATLWLTTAAGTRAERFYDEAGWRRAGVTNSGEVRFERDVKPWQR